MTEQTTYILLGLSPLVLGGVIAAANQDSINNITESIEAGIRRRQENVSQRGGWFYRFVLNPILLILVKFSDITDSFSHRGLKNGTRVAATFYFVGAWVYLMTIAFAFIAGIVITLFIAYYVIQYLNSRN